MPSNRQDAWTEDEDLLLAEVVLRHIREGGTQLKAFEEVGKKLSRTAAACGFRWNSYVRKQYQSGIELAKQQRKKLKKAKANKNADKLAENILEQGEIKGEQKSTNISFEEVIHYLNELYSDNVKGKEQNKNITEYEKQLEVLQNEMAKLKEENEKLKAELQTVEGDYRALLKIMEKARKLVNEHEEKIR